MANKNLLPFKPRVSSGLRGLKKSDAVSEWKDVVIVTLSNGNRSWYDITYALTSWQCKRLTST